MKLILKTFQWFIGISFFFNGISIVLQGHFIGAIISTLGIFMIPFFFDKLNLPFAEKQTSRRLSKVGLFFITIFAFGSVGDEIIQSKNKDIILSIANLNEQIAIKGIENIDKLEIDSIQNVLNGDSGVVSDSAKIYLKGLNELIAMLSFGSSKDSVLDYSRFVTNMQYMNKLQEGESIPFLQDSLLNIEYNRLLISNLRTKKDFSSEFDYFIYRANHASRNGYPVETTLYLDSILMKTRSFDIDVNLIAGALSYSKIDDKKFQRLLKYASRKYRKNVIINMSIASKYRKDNKLSNSYKYYTKVLKETPNDPKVLTELALIANERKRKKSAVKHLEKLNELGELNNETCNLLRELTRYFSHWTYFSNCCDGSVSPSTGRGSCSHHNGVCSTGKTPNYRYKYGRCKF